MSNLPPISPSAKTKYSLPTRLFHHVSLIMMVVLWALVEFEDSFDGAIGIHKALGAVFLLLIIGRLINVLIRPKIAGIDQPSWQVVAKNLTHLGLYLSMLAMPISGVLMSVYGGRPVDIFGLMQIPVFVTPDRQMASFFNDVHTDVVFPALIVLVVAHVGAALYHQFVLKDNLLTRMR